MLRTLGLIIVALLLLLMFGAVLLYSVGSGMPL